MSSAILPFDDKTPLGTNAFRRGLTVPPDAVNLAWVKSPQITPGQNVAVIDTSQITPENTNESISGLYYADELGVLQDFQGNQIFGEEFPYVTDILSISGDLTNADTTDATIFPFVHVSRFFHIDAIGLCLGSGLTNYTSNLIKVVDSKGALYLDNNGHPRYRVQICPVINHNVTLTNSPGPTQIGAQMPYRVYVYVDDNIRTDLYVTYNKVELNGAGDIINQKLNYEESLNPQAVYQFRPESAEVVDLANREKRWFSSRDAGYHNQILGRNTTNNNGYNIFVPKKALNDPRLFQPFRWRVTCKFSENFAVSKDQKTLNVGVIVTNNDSTSIAAQLWNSLSSQGVNTNNIEFTNPLATITDTTQDAYWYVNLDTLGDNYTQQLDQFDILVWVPTANYFDFSIYINQINYFTNTLGKTLLIDTENGMVPINFGISTTDGVSPTTGTAIHGGSFNPAVAGPATSLNTGSFSGSSLNAITSTQVPLTYPGAQFSWPYTSFSSPFNSGIVYGSTNLFNATALGGWNISANDPITTLQTDYGETGGYTQFITGVPPATTFHAFASTITNHVLNSSTVPSSTWSYTNNTGTFSYSQSALVTPATSSTTMTITVPTVTAGYTYQKTEVFQTTKFTGAQGSAMATYLKGGSVTAGFNNLEHLAIVDNTGSATLFAGDYSADATLPGTTVATTRADLIDGIPANAVTYQSIRATTYFYKNIATTTNVTVAPSTNFTVPVFTSSPVIIQVGNIYFSTINLISSAIKSVPGAMQLLYNMCLIATQNRPLSAANTSRYSSSYQFSSPWALSWVINTTSNPDVLSRAEKALYNFVYLPEDVDNPVYVWQRQLSSQTMRDLINSEMTTQQLIDTSNSIREYVIEVTNTNVNVPTTFNDDSLPYAWTLSYTPTLQVPADYNTYIIQEKEIPATYEAGQYISRSYPYRPYAFQVTATYDDAFTLASNASIAWTANCTATLTYDQSVYVPPQTIVTETLSRPTTQEVEVSWAKNFVGTKTFASNLNPYKNGTMPWGLFLWTQLNYYNTSFGPGQDNFVYNGLTGRYQLGSTGTPVQFLQDVLNKVMNAGLIVDGSYGSATANAVRTFQISVGARYIDGVTDAETWSLIGGAVIAHGLKNTGQSWGQFYDGCYHYMQPQSISDSNGGTIFGKRSWYVNGPSQIWEIFSVSFGSGTYNLHGVKFVPYVEGEAATMLFEAVHADITTDPASYLVGYDSERMMIKHMNLRVADNQATTISFSPRQANHILVGVGQDQTSFPISARFFGVRDIVGLATVTTAGGVPTIVQTTIPGYTKTTVQTKTVNLTDSGVTIVPTGTPVVIQCTPQFSGIGTLSNIKWASVNITGPNVVGSISSSGKLTLTNEGFNTQLGNTTEQGPFIDASMAVGATPQLWFSMDVNGHLNPWQETGKISKDEGLVLFCNHDGTPFAFPPLPPAQTNNQRILSTFRISTAGTDHHIRIGFYDKLRNQFITDANGDPVIAYNDYTTRGPQNIYVAAISTFEIDHLQTLPTFSSTDQILSNRNDAPYVPHMVVLPIYGVKINSRNRIGLAALPANLSSTNTWPIAVKPGKFVKQFIVPQDSNQFQYKTANDPLIAPGAKVTAFYEVDVTKSDRPKSTLFGPPNIDIIGESPIILDTNVIQVVQTPILMQQFPTNMHTAADPVIPIFTVYQRSTINDPWVALTWDQIADYNINTGIITLQSVTWSDDPNLWSVNYTSSYPYYIVKITDIVDFTQPGLIHQTIPVNLNPTQTNNQYVGQTLYVYVTPKLMLDVTGNQIQIQSPYSHPISFTTNKDLFNPNSPTYDPSVVLLGLIRVDNNFNVSDLVMIDSRVRGGGIPNDIPMMQAYNTLQEARDYWDINYGTGMSYQNAGFILIRLPATLKQTYPDAFIREVIDKNIPAGIAYKLEDLNGNDWDTI